MFTHYKIHPNERKPTSPIKNIIWVKIHKTKDRKPVLKEWSHLIGQLQTCARHQPIK